MTHDMRMRGRHGNASLVAQRLPEPYLPGDRGEVCQGAGVILHQDLAVHDAAWGGAMAVLDVEIWSGMKSLQT